MNPRTPHDSLQRARCPYCNTLNVKEIFAETDPKHRHVCMNKDCDKISANNMHRKAGLPLPYPGIKDIRE